MSMINDNANGDLLDRGENTKQGSNIVQNDTSQLENMSSAVQHTWEFNHSNEHYHLPLGNAIDVSTGITTSTLEEHRERQKHPEIKKASPEAGILQHDNCDKSLVSSLENHELLLPRVYQSRNPSPQTDSTQVPQSTCDKTMACSIHDPGQLSQIMPVDKLPIFRSNQPIFNSESNLMQTSDDYVNGQSSSTPSSSWMLPNLSNISENSIKMYTEDGVEPVSHNYCVASTSESNDNSHLPLNTSHRASLTSFPYSLGRKDKDVVSDHSMCSTTLPLGSSLQASNKLSDTNYSEKHDKTRDIVKSFTCESQLTSQSNIGIINIEKTKSKDVTHYDHHDKPNNLLEVGDGTGKEYSENQHLNKTYLDNFTLIKSPSELISSHGTLKHLKENIMSYIELQMKCKVCDFISDCPESIMKHVQTQHIMDKNMCTICNKPFTKPSDLASHVLGHSEALKCLKCSECFTLKKSAMEHFSDDHTQCNIDKYNSRKRNVSRKGLTHGQEKIIMHLTTISELLEYYDLSHKTKANVMSLVGKDETEHGKTVFKCLRCRLITDSITQIVSHVKQKHIAFQLNCTLCKHHFQSKDALQKHLNQHVRLTVCKLCKIDFPNKASGLFHLRTKHNTRKSQGQSKKPPRSPQQEVRISDENASIDSDENIKNKISTAVEEGTESDNSKPDGCSIARSSLRGRYKSLKNAVDLVNHYEVCNSQTSNIMSRIQHDGDVFVNGVSQLTCKVCLFKSTEPQTMVQHVRYQHFTKGLNCTVCPRKFQSLFKLDRHMQTHIKLFLCTLCSEVFSKKTSFVVHYNTSHKSRKKKFKSRRITNKCLKRKPTVTKITVPPSIMKDEDIMIGQAEYDEDDDKGELYKGEEEDNFLFLHGPDDLAKYYHIANKVKGNFMSYVARDEKDGQTRLTCTTCGFMGKTAADIVSHVRNVHLVLDLGCTACKKTYPNMYKLNKHMQFHMKVSICKICDKVFTMRSAVIKHYKMSHMSGLIRQRYTCNICQKSYLNNSNLKEHMARIHSGLSNASSEHLCPSCGISYTSKGSLNEHIKIKHTNAQPLKCPHCDKVFKYKSSLRVHINTHTKERAYTCEICGKVFWTMTSYSMHKAVHLEAKDRKYICYSCDRTFTQVGSLRRHILTHTKVKPYSCSMCSRKFNDSSARRRHMMQNHHLCDDQYKEMLKMNKGISSEVNSDTVLSRDTTKGPLLTFHMNPNEEILSLTNDKPFVDSSYQPETHRHEGMKHVQNSTGQDVSSTVTQHENLSSLQSTSHHVQPSLSQDILTVSQDAQLVQLGGANLTAIFPTDGRYQTTTYTLPQTQQSISQMKFWSNIVYK